MANKKSEFPVHVEAVLRQHPYLESVLEKIVLTNKQSKATSESWKVKIIRGDGSMSHAPIAAAISKKAMARSGCILADPKAEALRPKSTGLAAMRKSDDSGKLLAVEKASNKELQAKIEELEAQLKPTE